METVTGWEEYDKSMDDDERRELAAIRRRLKEAGTILSPVEYKLANPDPFWETWPGRSYSGNA
jgi:hypothetical protein